MEENRWGFLREKREQTEKVKFNEKYQIGATQMIDYLKVIFPEIEEDEWIHDKTVPNLMNGKKKSRIRPDFRNEKRKLIIEFDGLQHYTKPDNILRDEQHTEIYTTNGYEVVRIPYFIQLTKEVVTDLFGIEVSIPLFDVSIPSIAIEWHNTPAYLCPAGIDRMAKEYHRFPQQYEVNLKNLEKCRSDIRSGYDLLVKAYERVTL